MKKVTCLLIQPLFAGAIMFFSGCTNTKKEETKEIQQNSKETPVEANTQLAIDIEGMTCEKGCASLIKETVSEIPGVVSCNVNFENKSAQVSFDNKKTSEEKILQAISTLNDGQYKASKIKS